MASMVASMYRTMNGIETSLGGGEGVEGLYGSIKGSGMQKILDCMRDECDMDETSHIVDVGAGLGRPMLHALATGHVATATGVELDSVKCQKAASFFKLAIRQLKSKNIATCTFPEPSITCAPIEAVKTLDPATHAYSFWEGVPYDARLAFGQLFTASKTLQAVTVVQRSMRDEDPAHVMECYGFGGLTLVDAFPVSMSGSGRNFVAYVFNKTSTTTTTAVGVTTTTTTSPAVTTTISTTTPSKAAVGGVVGVENEEEEEVAVYVGTPDIKVDGSIYSSGDDGGSRSNRRNKRGLVQHEDVEASGRVEDSNNKKVKMSSQQKQLVGLRRTRRNNVVGKDVGLRSKNKSVGVGSGDGEVVVERGLSQPRGLGAM